MKKIASVLFAALLISGCAANKPKMSRQDWVDATSKVYQGKSKDDVLKSAERLFELADGDDFKIVHLEDGIYAERGWSIYFVIGFAVGADFWKVLATELNGETKVSVQVNTSAQGVGPTPTTGSAVGVGAYPMVGSPVMGTAIYDVFWARMDYLLGKRNTWMTCKESDERVEKKLVWGSNEALCNSFNMKDLAPN